MTNHIYMQGSAIGQGALDAVLDTDDHPVLLNQVLGRTNIGKGRGKNQDAASAFVGDKGLVLTVADGLGCYHYSEQAAYRAVVEVPHGMDRLSLDETCSQLHRELHAQMPYAIKGYDSEDSTQDSGATTLILAHIVDNQVTIANIGDSRAYVIRGGSIGFKSRDQSMGELIAHRQDINVPKSRRFQNILLNALGGPEPTYQFYEQGEVVTKDTGIPITTTYELEANDLVFLASDGVFKNLSDDEIVGLVTMDNWNGLNDSLHQSLQQILKTGKKNCGNMANPDNYTYVIYRHC